jgi:hypothetical protein
VSCAVLQLAVDEPANTTAPPAGSGDNTTTARPMVQGECSSQYTPTSTLTLT